MPPRHHTWMTDDRQLKGNIINVLLIGNALSKVHSFNICINGYLIFLSKVKSVGVAQDNILTLLYYIHISTFFKLQNFARLHTVFSQCNRSMLVRHPRLISVMQFSLASLLRHQLIQNAIFHIANFLIIQKTNHANQSLNQRSHVVLCTANPSSKQSTFLCLYTTDLH